MSSKVRKTLSKQSRGYIRQIMTNLCENSDMKTLENGHDTEMMPDANPQDNELS